MSFPPGNGDRSRGHPARRVLASVLLLLACSDAPARGAGVAASLVLLRQQVRRDSRIPVTKVEQPDDTTILVRLQESGRRWLTEAQRDTIARRTSERVTAYWPDPLLRRVEVVIERQRRLGPLVFSAGQSRFAFDAAVAATPPVIPGSAADGSLPRDLQAPPPPLPRPADSASGRAPPR